MAGCLTTGTGGLSKNATISGGEQVRIDFDNHGVVHAEDDDIRIETAVLKPEITVRANVTRVSPDDGNRIAREMDLDGDGADFEGKKVWYQFTFRVKHEHVQTPRSVKVEDVTDDAPVVWVTDEHPTLNANGVWLARIGPMDPDRMPWLNEIKSSLRVYRFTIVTSDGRTHILYEGASYPARVKKFFRK